MDPDPICYYRRRAFGRPVPGGTAPRAAARPGLTSIIARAKILRVGTRSVRARSWLRIGDRIVSFCRSGASLDYDYGDSNKKGRSLEN